MGVFSLFTMAKAQKLEGAVKARKRWFDVLATKDFNESVIGETTAIAPTQLIGRVINANLMNLTGNIKKQNINVKFRITSVRDNKYGVTEIVGYELMPAMIKRMVRRGRDKIDDSFIVKTADAKYIRIKPVLITAANTSRQIVSMLRQSVKYFVVKASSEKNYSDIVYEILSGKLQMDLNVFLKKDYPLRVCDIRAFQKVEALKPVKVEKAVKHEEKPEESDEEKESDFEEQKILDSVNKKEEVTADWTEELEKATKAIPTEKYEESPKRGGRRKQN
jgi:ribosomal protein S3AE